MDADKTPKFNPPRIVDATVMSEYEYEKTADRKLPEWVRCKVCKGKPEGMNWLKPISADPNCRELIHLGCMSKELLREFDGHRQV